MQVKKFEARSMQEALEMVKQHLGPDAIILSAKDRKNSFGLAGQASVEVTAAVSATTLRKKQIAEKRLNSQTLERYKQSSARTQKEFIEKVFNKASDESVTHRMTERPYIDIGDENQAAHDSATSSAQERIRNATQDALDAVQFLSDEEEEPEVVAPQQPQVEPRAESHSEMLAKLAPVLEEQKRLLQQQNEQQVQKLQSEISQLKGVLEQFQKVPQSMLTLHPGANEGVCFELSFMYDKLTRAGLSVENAVQILRKAQESLPKDQVKNRALVDAWVARHLLDSIQVTEERTSDRYHVFVGPAGQGKTSSLVKLASQLVIREGKKVAIATCDTFKVGASEQLRIFAQILNIPFAEIRKGSDWVVADEKLAHMDHILVDMPGFNLRGTGELDRLQSLVPPDRGGRVTHYVQSVLAKDTDANELATRYQSFGFNDVIFTRLDESVQHGLIYNFQKKFNVPLHSFGIGPQIPEDFEPATKERVVDLIFKLTKLRKDK